MIHIKDYPYEVYCQQCGKVALYCKEFFDGNVLSLNREIVINTNFSQPSEGESMTNCFCDNASLKIRKRKIRVFGHPWHLSHQFELFKIPFFDWTWLIQYKRPYSPHSRGDFVKNWVPYYEPGKYDLAILHLDQQCIEPELWERGKGKLYRELNQVIKDIPKIVIMHGTNYYPEFASKSEINERVKEIVGDNTMVTNSYEAAKGFGFGNPIWHGLDPKEWFDLPKEPRVVTQVSPGGLDKYYDRIFLAAIKEELSERGIEHCHITVDWQAEDWDDYRNFLGRSLIFLAPFKDSPMPRSRTEAMLSGCCVMTTPWQDADKFIVDGVNGVLIGDETRCIPRNPQLVADKIEAMLKDYKGTLAMGQAGRQTALEKFSQERYWQDWRNVVEKALNRKIE